MALRAPLYSGDPVAASQVPGIPTPSSNGAAISAAGEALSAVGGIVADVAEARAKEKAAATAAADEIAALSALEEIDRIYTETLYAPRVGLTRLENEALVDGYDSKREEYSKRVADRVSKLTPSQQALLAPKLASRRAAFDDVSSKYFASGMERYDDATTARALATNATSASVALAAGDTNAIGRALNDQHDILSSKYARNSYRLDPAAMAAEEEAEATKLVGAALSGALNAGDDELAAAILADYGDRMAPDARSRATADVAKAQRIGLVERTVAEIVDVALTAPGDATLAERESLAIADGRATGNKDVVAGIEARFADERRIRAQIAADAHTAVAADLLAGKTLAEAQMSPRWEQMTPDARRAEIKLYADRRKGLNEPAETDPALYLKALRMYSDPATRADFAALDIRNYRAYFKREDYNDLKGLWDSLQSDGDGADDQVPMMLRVAGEASKAMALQFRQGLSLSGKASEEDIERIEADVFKQMQRERKVAIAAGKPWGEAEANDVRDRNLAMIAYGDGDTKPAFLLVPDDIDADDITPERRKFIVGELSARSLPTGEDDVARAYINLLRYDDVEPPWDAEP